MNQQSTALRPVAGRTAVTGKATYRPEVQGLRALAVLMVVTYHIWFGRVSGGVDIFLLISAFLLSLSFIRKVESGRGLQLTRYWVHVFKRLLPGVVVVLLGTLAATALFVPRSRWTDILSQAWSSLFYFQNWALAADSVDYYAADHSGASPLQHFWSLSVQGQVFILWPLLFALAAWLAHACGLRFRRAVLLVFGLVFAASLVFSVYETGADQTFAYFDTRARLWEFALGTLLALALPYIRLSRGVKVAAGWVGLAAMLSAGFILDVQGQFPGYVALWPLLAAAFIILAGQTGSRLGADRLLSWKPLMKMGDMSYALYLWHWPVLVIYLVYRERSAAGPLGGLAIILVSLCLAYLTTRFVERPLRRFQWAEQRRLNSLAVIGLCMVLVAAPVFSWQAALRSQSSTALANADVNNPGAAVLDPYFSYEGAADAPVLPLADAASTDYVSLEAPCTGRFATDAPILQGYGCSEVVAPENPERVVVAVGNSHVQQWLAGLVPVAQEKNWELVALVKGGCQFEGYREGYSDSCNERNDEALNYIRDLGPDVLFTTATYAIEEEPYEILPGGLARMAREVIDLGTEVVGIRDNPRYPFNMAECPEEYGTESAKCNPPYETVSGGDHLLDAMGEAVPEMKFIDASDLFCPDGICRSVIGNVRVYLDNNHLSRTYVESMAPQLGRRFLDVLGW